MRGVHGHEHGALVGFGFAIVRLLALARALPVGGGSVSVWVAACCAIECAAGDAPFLLAGRGVLDCE